MNIVVQMIAGRCGGDVVSQEMNDHHEPFLVFRRHHTRPNQLFVSSFKYLGIVLSLAGDRALAEARACVEGINYTDSLQLFTINNNCRVACK